MDKRLFAKLKASMEQMNAIARGERALRMNALPVREINAKTKLSKTKSARLYS